MRVPDRQHNDLEHTIVESGSVDLIVTSPPYGNANDYHLYHRFRLLWLGHDPRGPRKDRDRSHLRHQKESSGFDAYMTEMEQCLMGMFRVLRPGRYAVLVVGDAVYKKVVFPTQMPSAQSPTTLGSRQYALWTDLFTVLIDPL